uniref:4F2 cell-surface antigen heavy chain n=1 Tax=Aceria tosichella TaxID=561515 RepID=A0A6G1SC71_9ACAR
MDSSKDQSKEATSGKEINIDINGDPDSTAVKNMESDDGPRVGLTKDELMKYANEPFWVRLRNILFTTFWIVWVSILVAAIGYVINSPGCKVAMASAAEVAKTGATNATQAAIPKSGG